MFGLRLERSGRLLFPSFVKGQEAVLVDVRKLVDRIAIRAGWKAGELTTRVFPPQLDGCPAADPRSWGTSEPVYRHPGARPRLGGDGPPRVCAPGNVRHRSEVMEFRPEQHLEALKVGSAGWDLAPRMTPREGQGRQTKPPLQPKSKRGMTFRSGPGATRTRDLLLRSAGPTANRHRRALILPHDPGVIASQR